MGEGNSLKYKYEEEDDVARTPTQERSRSDAEIAAETMLQRLRVDGAIINRIKVASPQANGDDADAWERMVQYATDVHLNIQWYRRARRQQEGQRDLFRWVTIGLGVATALLPGILYLVVRSRLGAAAPSLLETQLGLIVAAVGGGWKFITSLDNSNTRVGIFWEANAELSEEALSTERAWRGKAVKDGALSADFLAALEESRKRARAITKKERTAFFNTFKSPSEILKSASDFSGELTKARDALDKATLAAEAERVAASYEEKVAAAERALEAAKLALVIKEKIAEELEKRITSKDDPNLSRARAGVVEALAAKITAEQQLAALKPARA